MDSHNQEKYQPPKVSQINQQQQQQQQHGSTSHPHATHNPHNIFQKSNSHAPHGHHHAHHKKPANEDQRFKLLKNLIDLAPSKLFEYNFFMPSHDGQNIDANYDQVNSIMQIIENSRKKLPYQEEKAPQYDPKINQKMSMQTLKQRIQLINPGYPVAEINSLMPGKQEITSKELTEVLKQNEIKDFDPMQEALKFFCEDHTGNFSFNKLQTLLQELGYGALDKKDVEILKECLDIDKDGKISPKDLEEIFNHETFQFINQAYKKREYK